MKAIIINSCRECPLKDLDNNSWDWLCRKSSIIISNAITGKLPDTIHPDCRLNDVPTVDSKLIDFAVYLTGHDKETVEQMYSDYKKHNS